MALSNYCTPDAEFSIQFDYLMIISYLPVTRDSLNTLDSSPTLYTFKINDTQVSWHIDSQHSYFPDMREVPGSWLEGAIWQPDTVTLMHNEAQGCGYTLTHNDIRCAMSQYQQTFGDTPGSDKQCHTEDTWWYSWQLLCKSLSSQIFHTGLCDSTLGRLSWHMDTLLLSGCTIMSLLQGSLLARTLTHTNTHCTAGDLRHYFQSFLPTFTDTLNL